MALGQKNVFIVVLILQVARSVQENGQPRWSPIIAAESLQFFSERSVKTWENKLKKPFFL